MVLSIREDEYAASKLAGLFTLAKFTLNAFPCDSGFASVVTVRDCVAVNISWGATESRQGIGSPIESNTNSFE